MADDLYDKLMRDLIRGRESGANYKTLKARLWEVVADDRERYLTMFFNNWFNHNWTRPIPMVGEPRNNPKPKPYEPRKKPTAEEERERRKRDANMRGLTLMNSFLSDGETRVKDATGKQIRREFGWLRLIAKFVKPNEIVGRKLTDEQLFNLWSQATAAEGMAA